MIETDPIKHVKGPNNAFAHPAKASLVPYSVTSPLSLKIWLIPLAFILLGFAIDFFFISSESTPHPGNGSYHGVIVESLAHLEDVYYPLAFATLILCVAPLISYLWRKTPEPMDEGESLTLCEVYHEIRRLKVLGTFFLSIYFIILLVLLSIVTALRIEFFRPLLVFLLIFSPGPSLGLLLYHHSTYVQEARTILRNLSE